ncbi:MULTISPECIES: GntR family transcriptional regulator [Clostridia]|uniref:FadR/GntR family transcriptional regulator n=1 Tax=Clostridia TaxID=186801 RepID=UPI000EA1D416|nr:MULTISPECIES: GntR family transcriptional regulator [Clostridia]NBJ68997.1 FadR family transcriptional regulator [Roseburia sp. 1XD42-34]RKI79898.1 FadR family transcriptional regulator [Clostridium sp. 1xD42-85]
MAVSMSHKQKVYQGILQKIRHYMDTQHLQPGDKLPSERELAQTLGAGRSSIREALRAMEFLGLIETRRGEGTFLSTYQSFQTVELLASFILRESKTRIDLAETLRILEKEAAKLVFSKFTEQDVNYLQVILCKQDQTLEETHAVFFRYIFERSNNRLLTKVWRLMYEFLATAEGISYPRGFYEELIQLYATNHYDGIELLYLELAKK